MKPDSTTTKHRVVLGSGAKTTSGVSLKKCLMTGHKLHEDNFNILIHFRFFKIRMSADVAKSIGEFSSMKYIAITISFFRALAQMKTFIQTVSQE